MFEFLFDLIYTCCFGLKRRTSKFHKTVAMLEELTDDEFKKVMSYYNSNKRC